MDKAQSIAIVREYAEQWGICDLDAFRVESDRRLVFTVAHQLHLDNPDWTGFAYVERNAKQPSVFDFRPKETNLLMPPLWAAFPSYSAVTIGWRMSRGEDYSYAWAKWYGELTDAQRMDYQRRFPVPNDDRGWNLWFYDVGLPSE